ncbi:MAG TPA: DnaJ domain-containing protein [Rhodanobacteraceae bacterium]|nr:DnaJ domain-containing protein [Rhodanobacteraceae bacterium]
MDAASARPVDRGILDVVLALHRSPALRFDLRERPLPVDLDLILRLAAPSQPLLDDTARQCDVTPATLREAARFYLQQVLFEPGTDAYRVLGVAPDAAPERIREHHQWLQRWLHPDRNDDEGCAPFAAKLNWAWQQLRDERKRNAYDAKRAQAGASASHHGAQPVAVRATAWTTVPVPPSKRPGRWWRRGALGLAFGSCIALFVLALTRGGPPPSVSTDADTLAATPVASPISTSAQTPPAPTAPKVERHAETETAPASALASATPPPTHAVPTRVAVTRAITKRIATVSTRERVHNVQRAATLPVVDTLPAPPTLRAAAVVAPVAAPAPRVTTQPADTIHPLPPVALATAQPAASATVPTIKAPAPPLAPEVLLQRVDLARKRARLLVAYFRSDDHTVPDWRHAPAPFNASLQRAALRQRHGLPDAATFALDQPVWRFSDDHIAMDADYRVQHDRSVIERGRFQLRMVWLDNAWQITHIQLEPRG